MQSNEFIGSLVAVEIDRPLGSRHPEYGSDYPINYGHVPRTKAPDGEPIDAHVLGIAEPSTRFHGRCIAVIRRLDDDDDKLVIVPDGVELTDEQIRKATDFQERYFESIIERRLTR